ncbi:hypothetical protein AMTRI_Chr06g191520 [Amborella trichopoda]
MAHEGEIGTAGDGELLHMRNEQPYAWGVATFAYLFRAFKKFVTIKVKKETQDLLHDNRVAPGRHLSGLLLCCHVTHCRDVQLYNRAAVKNISII